MRHAATMHPRYPLTMTSRPSFDERLASLTLMTYSMAWANSLRISTICELSGAGFAACFLEDEMV